MISGSRTASPLSETFNFWTRHRYFPHFVLLLLSVGPFLSSLNGDFVFDDAETIINNPIVNGKESLWNVSKIWIAENLSYSWQYSKFNYFLEGMKYSGIHSRFLGSTNIIRCEPQELSSCYYINFLVSSITYFCYRSFAHQNISLNV